MLNKSLLSVCMTASVLLTACHDDDNGYTNNTSLTPTTNYSNLTGTAAVGAAIQNANVTASCKDGTGFRDRVKTNDKGQWSGQVDSSKLPCVLQVTASDSQTLHGYAAKAGNVNITPFSDLALALASSQTPGDWYKTYQPILETTLQTAVDNLIRQLKADGYVLPENFDLLTTKFAIDDGFDQALDAFAASLDANKATIQDYAALVDKIKTGNIAALPDAMPTNPSTDPTVSGPLTAPSSSNTAEFLNALKKDDYYLKVESSFGGAVAEFPVGSVHKVGITKEGNVTIQGKTQAFTYSYRQHTLSDFHSNALTFYNAAGTGVELYISYDPATGYLTVEPQGLAGGESGVKLVSNKRTASTTEPTTPTEPSLPVTSQVDYKTGACTTNSGNGHYANCGASTLSDFTDTIPASPSGTYAACTITKTSNTITVKQTTPKGENRTVSAKLDGGTSDILSVKTASQMVIASDTTISNSAVNGPSITVSIANGQVVQVNTQVYADSAPTPDGLIVCMR